ncbi:hypothetical protein GCM10010531_28230 [Blastococcus jejuensis]|uniref:Uncharacterized protein n=1 Tax=Blastococcus jejuensis TaxID=351224 RepID=A0ABP6PAQ6_9ACTN
MLLRGGVAGAGAPVVRAPARATDIAGDCAVDWSVRVICSLLVSRTRDVRARRSRQSRSCRDCPTDPIPEAPDDRARACAVRLAGLRTRGRAGLPVGSYWPSLPRCSHTQCI